MLWLIGLAIAYFSAVWVAMVVLKNSEGDSTLIPLATMGFPSAIYATLAYIIGPNTMPQNYVDISVFSVALASLGVNIGRVIADPPLIKEVKKDSSTRSMAIVMNAFLETGAIFSLLVFLLGYMAFGNNDWTSLIRSPEAFLTGMEIMGIASAIGGIAVGMTIRASLQRLEEKGIALREGGFRKLVIYSAFPEEIWVFGLLFALLIFMGSI